MSGEPYDVQGEVRQALSTAVDSYGKWVLNDPRVLGDLMTDRLPGHPRERSLLVTAAEARIAGELTRNIEGQHMEPGAAVALAARSLAESHSLDAAASTWVATEYAGALGYQVDAQASPLAWDTPAPAWGTPSPAWPSPAPVPADLPDLGHAPTQATSPASSTSPPATPPPASPWGQNPTQPPSPAPSPGPAPASPPPASPWPSTPARPQSPRRGLFLGSGFVAVVVVLYLIAAAVLSVFPFSGSKSNGIAAPVVSSPSPGPTTRAGTAPPAASSSPPAQAAAGVKQLKVLMPYDLADVSTECVEQAKIPFTNPGLVRALDCVAPDMANGEIFGYQLDSHADYLKAWANYNAWAQFGTSSTLNCPPASGDAQGGPGKWWGPRFAKRAGQVLECFTSSTGPVYVWTYPSEDAFVVAQPPKTWKFSKLETWWEDNAV